MIGEVVHRLLLRGRLVEQLQVALERVPARAEQPQQQQARRVERAPRVDQVLLPQRHLGLGGHLLRCGHVAELDAVERLPELVVRQGERLLRDLDLLLGERAVPVRLLGLRDERFREAAQLVLGGTRVQAGLAQAGQVHVEPVAAQQRLRRGEADVRGVIARQRGVIRHQARGPLHDGLAGAQAQQRAGRQELRQAEQPDLRLRGRRPFTWS